MAATFGQSDGLQWSNRDGPGSPEQRHWHTNGVILRGTTSGRCHVDQAHRWTGMSPSRVAFRPEAVLRRAAGGRRAGDALFGARVPSPRLLVGRQHRPAGCEKAGFTYEGLAQRGMCTAVCRPDVCCSVRRSLSTAGVTAKAPASPGPSRRTQLMMRPTAARNADRFPRTASRSVCATESIGLFAWPSPTALHGGPDRLNEAAASSGVEPRTSRTGAVRRTGLAADRRPTSPNRPAPSTTTARAPHRAGPVTQAASRPPATSANGLFHLTGDIDALVAAAASGFWIAAPASPSYFSRGTVGTPILSSGVVRARVRRPTRAPARRGHHLVTSGAH